MILLRCIFLSCLLFTAQAFAQLNLLNQQPDFLPVEQAYQLTVEFGDNNLFLVWQLEEAYYLYRHGFTHQWQHADGSREDIAMSVPDGIRKHDEYFGETEVYYHQVVVTLPLPLQRTVLKASSQGCADAGLCYPPYHQFFDIDPLARTAEPVAQPAALRNSVALAEQGLSGGIALVLISAFLGGLILNLMPCVFPVLGIKVMQLTQQFDRRAMRVHGLAYLAGVVLSFLLVASVMLGLRSAGSAIGWGFQLQNPWFVATLVYLFFVLALAMAGVLQFGLRWMGVGQSLTQGKGASSAFFTGVLAVVVASPCTAPFMGSALGFAVAQPLPLALLVFAVLGLGMALPLTLLSFLPQWAALLPKPGLWMERLKQFFAFPLLITAIWLLWVLGNQAGTTAMGIILLGCVGLLFAFWCFRGGLISRALGLIALLLAISLPFSGQLAVQADAGKTSRFVAYSEAALADLRSQGVPVFIDLTADWCITCIANEKSTLHTEDIQKAFNEAGIVYMVGDWTHYNPEITALLERYRRNGIPLYLLFPAEADAPALILPQLLSKRIVLDAIANM